jgi:hypothetical protein
LFSSQFLQNLQFRDAGEFIDFPEYFRRGRLKTLPLVQGGETPIQLIRSVYAATEICSTPTNIIVGRFSNLENLALSTHGLLELIDSPRSHGYSTFLRAKLSQLNITILDDPFPWSQMQRSDAISSITRIAFAQALQHLPRLDIFSPTCWFAVRLSSDSQVLLHLRQVKHRLILVGSDEERAVLKNEDFRGAKHFVPSSEECHMFDNDYISVWSKSF